MSSRRWAFIVWPSICRCSGLSRLWPPGGLEHPQATLACGASGLVGDCAGLYRRQSMEEVLSTLDLALPSERAEAVSKSAITQARARLGQAPLRWLFAHTAQAWCAQDKARHAWKGLSLWAMDGTTFRVPDSEENRAHFGAQAYASGKLASYPASARAVNVHLHPDRIRLPTSPSALTARTKCFTPRPSLAPLPITTLTVFDRGFLSAEILLGLTLSGERRHFLIPAKSNSRRWESPLGRIRRTAACALRVSRLSQSQSASSAQILGGACSTGRIWPAGGCARCSRH